jgi:hypothetical protein
MLQTQKQTALALFEYLLIYHNAGIELLWRHGNFPENLTRSARASRNRVY